MSKEYQSAIFILSFSLIQSQPLNWETIDIDCKEYQFNPKQVKIKLSKAYAPYLLNFVKVDIPDTVYFKYSYCDERLPWVSHTGDIGKQLEDIILKAQPKKNNSKKLNLHIKDIRIIYNELPTYNPRLYVSMDFYLENDTKEMALAFSSTESIPLANNIERPLGRLIKFMIHDFEQYNRYIYNYVTDNSLDGEDAKVGIYTSFLDFKDENTVSIDHPVYCYFDGSKYYLNIGFYYSKGYFLEMNELSDRYYFVFDKVYDYTSATNKTIGYGGGLIGAMAGSASATHKSPAIIDCETGKLITLTKPTLQNFLGNEYENYASLVKEENRTEVVRIFKEIIANDEKRKTLLGLDP